MGIVIGGLAGFYIAMKASPKFSRAVRSSQMLRPVTSSRAFRQSFGNLLEAESGLKQYFLKMEEYPGDSGSNQWNILNKELEDYIEP